MLALLATQVPGVPTLLTGVGSSSRGPTTRLTTIGRLDELLLTAAGVVVWVLLIWLGGVVALAVAARLVHGTGSGTAAVVRCLTPRALRGVLITAVGVGSVGALAGCAPAAGAFTGPVGDPTTVSSSTAPPSDTIDNVWDLDWPTADATAATSSGTATITPSDPPAADQTTAATTPVETAPETSVATTEPTASAQPNTSGPADAVPTDSAPAPTGPPPDPATPAPAPADPVPDATTPEPEPLTAAPQSPGPSDGMTALGTVTVNRGDSLWSIAAAHLGPDATDVQIADAWPRWYQTNLAVIGDNPDLILPGTELSVPGSATR